MCKCKCPESKKPVTERQWVVTQYRRQGSAFNGCRYTPSNCSQVRCKCCGATWRTMATYVEGLKHDERGG